MEIAAFSTSVIAGCSERPTNSTVTSMTKTSTTSPVSVTESPSGTEAVTASPRDASNSIVVAPDGSDSNPGTADAPLGSIQKAFDVAQPGETIHVGDGEYNETIDTIRSGTTDSPITIKGSKDAVVRGDPEANTILTISHSHIHLRGLTFNGLQNPSEPDEPDSYIQKLIHCIPPFDTDEYLEDIVIAPAGIGNAYRPLMLFNRTKHLEIGPTKIIGLAGAVYVLGDAEDHTGEIIYLGKPPENALQVEPRPDYPWEGLDQSRHVHIHHIDNSAGHPHAELVNTKLGTRDVVVEYCTSLGGSMNTEPYPTADVRFQSYDATLRWSHLHGGEGYGVHIVDHRDLLREYGAAVAPETSGTRHSIYENVITGFGEDGIKITTSAEEQQILCGNVVTGSTDGDPLIHCPNGISEGDGIGHTHLSSSQFPEWSPVELRFNKTVNPSEQDPDNTDDRELAFKCHNISLLDEGGSSVLSVNVGTEESDIVFVGGIYSATARGDESWRWFGGPDALTRLYFQSDILDAATRMKLRGLPSTSDLTVNLYREGTLVDGTDFDGGNLKTYTLALTKT